MSAQPHPPAPVPFREITLDLEQLEANVARFRELTEGAPLFVDVGADAWGHGLDVVVPALVRLGAQALVTARLDEARRVRALAPETLLVTTQHAVDEDFRAAAELGVAPLVRTAGEFARAVGGGVTGVVLAEDTGDGLPGLAPDELDALTAEAERRGIAVLVDSAFPVIGCELLGVSEQDLDVSGQFPPVLSLWAPIAATKRVGPDEGVSYGYTYRTTGETTLALVTLGYGDGLSRAAGNRVEASVPLGDETVRRTIAGRVAMDAFMLDLGDVPEPLLGTPVTVLGDARRGEPAVFAHARALGTHSAEITTRLSPRPRRRPTEGDA
ncbi:alanine racemase [Gryllotalpicola ginsengisoli]|uniref:alanine racemase n=1 Tax=Gryllotalpicola ginsengisoli TaxID=444608 RepID=UPI0003B635DC|nr:alanine racemase C-terminal domain-containing protein [Gryllotalpicola ginsengisoli]